MGILKIAAIFICRMVIAAEWFVLVLLLFTKQCFLHLNAFGEGVNWGIFAFCRYEQSDPLRWKKKINLHNNGYKIGIPKCATTPLSGGIFPEQLYFCSSNLSRSFKLGLFWNLSCLNSWFYHPFFSNNLNYHHQQQQQKQAFIYTWSIFHAFLFNYRPQNVNDLHGVGIVLRDDVMKYCSEEMWEY